MSRKCLGIETYMLRLQYTTYLINLACNMLGMRFSESEITIQMLNHCRTYFGQFFLPFRFERVSKAWQISSEEIESIGLIRQPAPHIWTVTGELSTSPFRSVHYKKGHDSLTAFLKKMKMKYADDGKQQARFYLSAKEKVQYSDKGYYSSIAGTFQTSNNKKIETFLCSIANDRHYAKNMELTCECCTRKLDKPISSPNFNNAAKETSDETVEVQNKRIKLDKEPNSDNGENKDTATSDFEFITFADVDHNYQALLEIPQNQLLNTTDHVQCQDNADLSTNKTYAEVRTTDADPFIASNEEIDSIFDAYFKNDGQNVDNVLDITDIVMQDWQSDSKPDGSEQPQQSQQTQELQQTEQTYQLQQLQQLPQQAQTQEINQIEQIFQTESELHQTHSLESQHQQQGAQTVQCSGEMWPQELNQIGQIFQTENELQQHQSNENNMYINMSDLHTIDFSALK